MHGGTGRSSIAATPRDADLYAGARLRKCDLHLLRRDACKRDLGASIPRSVHLPSPAAGVEIDESRAGRPLSERAKKVRGSAGPRKRDTYCEVERHFQRRAGDGFHELVPSTLQPQEYLRNRLLDDDAKPELRVLRLSHHLPPARLALSRDEISILTLVL